MDFGRENSAAAELSRDEDQAAGPQLLGTAEF
jgi:hypothetical protein